MSTSEEKAISKRWRSIPADVFEADTIGNLETSFAGVAEELRRQYSIGYYPEQSGAPGERRSVRIKVPTKPNVVVRAKSGYVIRQVRRNVGGNAKVDLAGK